MSIDKETRNLRKGCQKSRQAIPIEAGMLVISVAIIWGLERFFAIPFWVKAIIVGMLIYSLVGDLLNVYFSNRRLRKLEGIHGHDTQP